jgi:hypothetical protein
MEFAEEKGNLARIYRSEITRISRDPNLLASAEAGIKADLRAATMKFNQALEANHAATKAIRKITEGMVKSEATEGASQRASQTGYGAHGSNCDSGQSMSAITLDRRV